MATVLPFRRSQPDSMHCRQGSCVTGFALLPGVGRTPRPTPEMRAGGHVGLRAVILRQFPPRATRKRVQADPRDGLPQIHKGQSAGLFTRDCPLVQAVPDEIGGA